MLPTLATALATALAAAALAAALAAAHAAVPNRRDRSQNMGYSGTCRYTPHLVYQATV